MVYRPTARVLAVLELLQAHGRMTGAELARRLEVDVRTVRKYVETLQDLGIPVEATRGRYGAYRLRPGFRLPPLIFSEDEAVALTLSLLVARRAGLTAEVDFEAVLAKVERVLPAASRDRVQAVEALVAVGGGAPVPGPRSRTVAVLTAAIQASRRVCLRYRSAAGEATERVVDPHGVACYDGFWYAVGHCHLRQAPRLFRLDRIVTVDMLAEEFERPPDFDALGAVQGALAAVPRRWQVEVWFAAPLAESLQRVTLSAGHFAAEGGGTVVRVSVDDLRWMACCIAGSGLPCVVREPAELREALRVYAREIAINAGRG